MLFERRQIEDSGGDWKAAEMINAALTGLLAARKSEVRTADYFESKVAFKYATLRQGLTYIPA